MSRTIRYNNGLNKGRDDKPFGSKCGPDSNHPNGFNTLDDDHGHYGAGGSRSMKKQTSAARRLYGKKILKTEVHPS